MLIPQRNEIWSMSHDITHHIKAIRPALNMMQGLGFSNEACLQDTGIHPDLLDDTSLGITLDQELAFHRRLLALSGDPLLGLKLGEAYRIESYGVLGYAMLSAATLAEAMALASQFDLLTFTHFDLDLRVEGDIARLVLKKQKLFDADLLRLYEDRELSAILSGGEHALGIRLRPQRIHIMHGTDGHADRYREYFGCPVEFDCPQTEFYFPAELLKTPMPLRDPETSDYCREQCQKLMTRLSGASDFSDQIRRLIIAQPGRFPSIEELADQTNSSTRTIRRRLNQEGTNYQRLLNEIRYALAKDYLTTRWSIERIAEMLGYSDATNFSHAFKRWHGCSPKAYRDQKGQAV